MSISVYSYNSRGFDVSKQEICQTLMKNAGNNLSILCNQENFLLEANVFKIKQCLPNCHIFYKYASKYGKTGRPKNGIAQSTIKYRTTDVSPDSS